MHNIKIFAYLIFFILLTTPVFAQQPAVEDNMSPAITATEGEISAETNSAVSSPGNVTLDFKDADINNVLRILSYKSGMNIVAGNDVQGLVTIRLKDVPWEKALNVILKTYNYGYEKDENIISVYPMEKLAELKRAEQDLADIEPTLTKVYKLKYLDAGDAKNIIEPQLSPRGKITVVEVTGQKGWEFSTGGGLEKRARTEKENIRSKSLVITDVADYHKKIEEVLALIDTMPKQILIEARIVEVSRDALEDVGFDWGTGTTGASSADLTSIALDKVTNTGSRAQDMVSQVAGHSLSDQVTPSVFGPETTGLTTANTGLRLSYAKLYGSQFEVVMHALEEKIDANTLSAPRVLTMNNQEATMLVGTKYPILESSTEEGVVTTSLSYYEDIGIQLNVVPQISGGEFIDMIIHPAVTSFTQTVGDNAYPVILVREAETQILMRDGETIVIGGLLKDVKSHSKIGVPVLGRIPIIGVLFQRRTEDIEKVDLLIFITATIVDPGEVTSEEIALFKQRQKQIDYESFFETTVISKDNLKKRREDANTEKK